jgi:S-adenosylmethionine decarboxylase
MEGSIHKDGWKGHSFGRATQLLADCFDCDGKRLTDSGALQRIMVQSALSTGATVLGESRCDYVPHGLTLITFLAESHILITTWPEHQFAICELMLCNESMDPHRALRVLTDFLAPGRVLVKEVVHDMNPALLVPQAVGEIDKACAATQFDNGL